MKKNVLDNLRPEPRHKMWQKFDNEGIVHKEFVPSGQTANGKFYCHVLRWVRENIRRKCPDKRYNNSWGLHHVNAPGHASLIVQQFLASMKTTVIPHPPYSLDLTTCSFFLFPNIILKLKGWSFDSIEEIQTKSQDVMMTDTKWLPAVLPIMKILLGSLYQCRSGLLRRGWGRIEILVSG